MVPPINVASPPPPLFVAYRLVPGKVGPAAGGCSCSFCSWIPLPVSPQRTARVSTSRSSGILASGVCGNSRQALKPALASITRQNSALQQQQQQLFLAGWRRVKKSPLWILATSDLSSSSACCFFSCRWRAPPPPPLALGRSARPPAPTDTVTARGDEARTRHTGRPPHLQLQQQRQSPLTS